MDKAAEESKRKAEAEATRKRQALADQLQSQQQNKRRRLNPTNEVARLFAASNPEGIARVQSVAALPHAAVVDLLVSALQGVAPSTLTEAISVSSEAAAIQSSGRSPFGNIGRQARAREQPLCNTLARGHADAFRTRRR